MERIVNWAKENKEKYLKAEVRNMNPQEREEYLMKVADIYLAEMGYNKKYFYLDLSKRKKSE